MKSLFNRYREMIAYLFWGIITTIVNLMVFIGLHYLTNINYQVNNVIAWIISVLVAYLSNKKYVFHSKTTSIKQTITQMSSFFGGRLASLLVEQVILWVGIALLSGNQIIVKIIDNVIIVVLNYFWSKWAVFKNNKGDDHYE